jgi:F-type H+-transporting ATPase subunit gamma
MFSAKYLALIALGAAGADAFMTGPSTIAPTAFRGDALCASGPTRSNRAVGPLMSGTKELRNRVESVKNTKKITSAMRLVAAAKVRRAQDAVLKTRPFSETLQKVLGGLIERLKKDNFDSPLLQEREVKKVLVVSLTGDRGLCGGYNSYAIKKAETRVNELKEQGLDFDMITVGGKGTQYFGKRYNVVKSYNIGNAPTADEATAIADNILATYLSGEADRVELVYTRFTSLIASEPSVRTMLPLNPTGIETEGDEIFTMTSKDGQFAVDAKIADPAAPQQFPKDMIFEQDPEQILSAILPLYFNGQLLRQMQESVASELAARMTAMQAATDNASDLINLLTQQMNRQRQAAITQEIAEIVAGANS